MKHWIHFLLSSLWPPTSNMLGKNGIGGLTRGGGCSSFAAPRPGPRLSLPSDVVDWPHGASLVWPWWVSTPSISLLPALALWSVSSSRLLSSRGSPLPASSSSAPAQAGSPSQHVELRYLSPRTDHLHSRVCMGCGSACPPRMTHHPGPGVLPTHLLEVDFVHLESGLENP